MAESLAEGEVREEGDDRDQAGNGHIVALADDGHDVLPALPGGAHRPADDAADDRQEGQDNKTSVSTHVVETVEAPSFPVKDLPVSVCRRSLAGLSQVSGMRQASVVPSGAMSSFRAPPSMPAQEPQRRRIETAG